MKEAIAKGGVATAGPPPLPTTTRGPSRAAIPRGAATELGRRIRERRHELGLTQADLAGIDVTKALISQIETGVTRPSPATLALIASRLGWCVEELLADLGVGRCAADDGVALLLQRVQARLAAGRSADAKQAIEEISVDALRSADRLVFHRLAADLDDADGAVGSSLENGLTACRYASHSNDPEQIALAYNAVGRAHFRLNRLAAAIAYYDAALDSARQPGADPVTLARIETNRGNALMCLGDAQAAEQSYLRARDAAEEAENFRQLALAHMGVGEAARERGDFTTAVAHMESAVELFDRLENRQLAIQNLHNLGEAYAERGDYTKARAYHEDARRAAAAIGDVSTCGYAQERLAAHDVREGAFLKGLRGAQEAVATARAVGDQDLLARALATVGDACQGLGDVEQADAAYRDALDQARAAGGRALRQVLLQQGATLRSRGDLVASATAFEEAARIVDR